MIRTFLARAGTLLLLALALSLTSAARAQNTNFNITLLSNVKPSVFPIDYGDVWAEGNIACLGVWRGYSTYNYGVGIYSISNPAAPVLLSVYTTTPSTHNQFEQGVVRNKIGYFASWNGGGVHIVSLTNPAAPLFLSRIHTNENGFSIVHTLFVDRDYLYEAAHVNNIETVKVFNIANPLAPVFLWDIVTTNTLKVHQMTVANKGSSKILYTSGWGNNSGTSNVPGQTEMWDVTNVGAEPPRWLGRIYSGRSSHSSWPTPDGNALVVCREIAGGEVTIYDISNPAAPFPLTVITPASMGLENDVPHNPVVVSNLLFLSWYQNGIQVFDITDLRKPVRVGAYDTFLNSRSTTFEGNWGIFPFLGLNKILLSDIQSGFYVMDASGVLTGTNNYAPLLVNSPMSLTTTQGLTATLTNLVTGSALQYQWLLDDLPLEGATNRFLVFNEVQGSNSGFYRVIVTNAFGAVTSSVAALNVVVLTNMTPTITSQPQHQSVFAEQSATFSVAVLGSGPFAFQWRFNGNDLPGATNSSFTRPSSQGEHVGAYSVLISNDAGSVTSANAFLTIIDSPYLSAVQATAGARSAFVTWKTTVAADGQVQFDPEGAPSQAQFASFSSTASFSLSSPTDPTLSTNHTIMLTGLTPATGYNFQVVSSVGGSNFISGVYSFTTLGKPLIIDNTSTNVAFTGTWGTSANNAGFYGTNYRIASTTTNTSATHTWTFTPNLLAGVYDVSLWYPPAATNRSPNVPFSIGHPGGINTGLLNQQINGGQWNDIGSGIRFGTGTNGFVRLANNAANNPPNTLVVADAVQFVYQEESDFPTDGSIPGWWSVFYFGGTVDPGLDPDGDGYTSGQEYLLGTSPIAANAGLSVRVVRSGNNANVIFRPYVGDRTYTLLQSSDLGEWNPVSANIFPGSFGEGVFSVPINGASGNFYRLSVELTTTSPSFAGSLPTPKDKSFSPYATEPVCGPNRAYVK